MEEKQRVVEIQKEKRGRKLRQRRGKRGEARCGEKTAGMTQRRRLDKNHSRTRSGQHSSRQPAVGVN